MRQGAASLSISFFLRLMMELGPTLIILSTEERFCRAPARAAHLPNQVVISASQPLR
jgi:hypothetical protein